MFPSFVVIKAFVVQNLWLSLGFAVLLLGFILNEWRAAKSGAKTITPQQAVLLMNHESVPLIDVREPKAFLENHILDTKNIPLSTLSLLTLAQFDSDKRLIVLADIGAQTNAAVAKLKELKFEDILVLDGGLEGWKSAGFPLKTFKGVKK